MFSIYGTGLPGKGSLHKSLWIQVLWLLLFFLSTFFVFFSFLLLHLVVHDKVLLQSLVHYYLIGDRCQLCNIISQELKSGGGEGAFHTRSCIPLLCCLVHHSAWYKSCFCIGFHFEVFFYQLTPIKNPVRIIRCIKN